MNSFLVTFAHQHLPVCLYQAFVKLNLVKKLHERDHSKPCAHWSGHGCIPEICQTAVVDVLKLFIDIFTCQLDPFAKRSCPFTLNRKESPPGSPSIGSWISSMVLEEYFCLSICSKYGMWQRKGFFLAWIPPSAARSKVLRRRWEWNRLSSRTGPVRRTRSAT